MNHKILFVQWTESYICAYFLLYVLCSKLLDETTAQLKRTGVALEKEKAKADMLLHQMLPIKVANQLREGRKVKAGKICIFHHIHQFTTITRPSVGKQLNFNPRDF